MESGFGMPTCMGEKKLAFEEAIRELAPLSHNNWMKEKLAEG